MNWQGMEDAYWRTLTADHVQELVKIVHQRIVYEIPKWSWHLDPYIAIFKKEELQKIYDLELVQRPLK